ncbi:hypothetical protein [Halorhabdus rudnickae]|uniref:hypothetical protein n=1 Tax=Halorhabdus rudnickae TaxID=1775544 RepID=UPI001FCEF1E6|nr:hypothetical protein [Halorhabdus rudnickae]
MGAALLDSGAALLANGDVFLQSWQAGTIDAVINVLSQPEIWIGAAAGGAFGAALGALPAFAFTGFLVLAGVFGGDAALGVGTGLGFGPVFGPHISFAGGAAAAAYAAKQGLMESGFDYHNGKDINFALGSRPDILAVGAAFGMFGILMEQTLRNLAVPTDPIAITVVGSAFLHRIVFGYPVVGILSEKTDGFFDMGPFERGEMRSEGEVPFGDGEKEPTDMLAVEPWLPNMYKWSHVASIGLVAGAAAGYAALQTGNPFIGFGISAATLLFLNLGVDRIPVTHHMTLPAATAYLAVTMNPSGVDAILMGADPWVGMVAAALFGLLGALLGEVLQRIFYAHGSTHVDPPAFSIFITHSIIAVLAIAGVFATAVWVPGAAF